MRERAEKELKGSYDRQNSILTAIPDIIMEVNNDKVYTWANQAGYDFFGDDVIGKEAARYFIGDQKTYDIVQPVFTGDEKAVYVESWQRRKDGQKRLLAWYCTSRKDDSGAIIGAFSSARDITEHNIAEDALRKIRQDLERRVGELEVFHEITMGRESRIVELKNEMEKLKAELARYKKDR
jgi:PAS domain S-box-containing protein